MKILKQTVAIACGVFTITTASVGAEKEELLIDKIVDAYGGSAVTGLKAMTINDRYKVLAVGQSADPSMMDIGLNYVELTVDFENRRKNLVNWNKNRGGSFLNQVIHDGEVAHTINHLSRTQAQNANLQYSVLGGGVLRTTDTALVKLLQEARSSASHGGEEIYRGRPHEKLTFKMEGSPDLTIYVDQQSGLIAKMERTNPQLGILSYLFGEHRTSKGITYASNMDFLIAGQPNIVSISRQIDFAPDLSGVFDAPNGYLEQGSNIDTSEMIVRDLGDGVYYAGQGAGFSIFVDVGDHFVAAGGYPALPARFTAVQEMAGVNKPLGKQVVTHHHTDHLGGMNEAAELGASFVTVANHVQSIRDAVNADVPDEKFELVEGRMDIGGGKVQVFDISTAHSSQYLLFYVPSAKLVFSADHFSTNLAEGLPTANNNMVTFRRAVEALDIDAQNFLGAHGARPLTMEDLRRVTDGYQDKGCPAGFDICAD